MRMSVHEGPGYLNWLQNKREKSQIRVLLNGSAIEECVELDTSAGWLRRHVLVDGKVQIAPDRRSLVEETLHGRVEIQIRRPGGEWLPAIDYESPPSVPTTESGAAGNDEGSAARGDL